MPSKKRAAKKSPPSAERPSRKPQAFCTPAAPISVEYAREVHEAGGIVGHSHIRTHTTTEADGTETSLTHCIVCGMQEGGAHGLPLLPLDERHHVGKPSEPTP